MPTNSKEKIIKEIAKNDLEKVVLSLRIWRERILIDLRIQYKDKAGIWLNQKLKILNWDNDQIKCLAHSN